MLKSRYIFTSERLGFRDWNDDDLDEFAEINADPKVMEHFPKPLTREETKGFIDRLQKHYIANGHNYFAAEILETGELIGFIGLALQTYESDFTPNVDIGWRLKTSAWRKGYATEGAKRCLDLAFNELKLEKVISTCVLINTNSENVMKKLGMRKVKTFTHPNLKDYPEMGDSVLYEINRKDYI